jgi:hypothetical protein
VGRALCSSHQRENPRGRRCPPKRIEEWTAEDWAQYGIGDPVSYDENGVPIFRDYRQIPREAQHVESPLLPGAVIVDGSLLGILTNWRLVIDDMLAIYRLDLYDPAVLARPWPGVRTALYGLLDRPESRLRAALTRRAGS